MFAALPHEKRSVFSFCAPRASDGQHTAVRLHQRAGHVCSAFQGVLRIHFIEAQDLQGKDTYLKGLVKGKSDPYGVIRVGNQVFQSKVIKENLSPKWSEVYEVRRLIRCLALSQSHTGACFI